MPNRVRIVTANLLTKLLLIDRRWGVRHFAEKLHVYEQASNMGNWQWSSGCGADAALCFRIFNPDTQIQKYDLIWKVLKSWYRNTGQTFIRSRRLIIDPPENFRSIGFNLIFRNKKYDILFVLDKTDNAHNARI